MYNNIYDIYLHTHTHTHNHTQSQNLEQILKVCQRFSGFKDITFNLFNYFICSKSLRPRPLRFLPKSTFLRTDKHKAFHPNILPEKK